MSTTVARLALIALFSLPCACADEANQGAATGMSCVPDDELRPGFGYFAKDEVNVARDDTDCGGDVCMTLYFQGRVTCPYGQAMPNGGCLTSDGEQSIAVPVLPQLFDRRPADSVYCTCRCGGSGEDTNYCSCPDGFTCTELIDALPGGASEELSGSFCVKNGTGAPPTDDVICRSGSAMSCE